MKDSQTTQVRNNDWDCNECPCNASGKPVPRKISVDYDVLCLAADREDDGRFVPGVVFPSRTEDGYGTCKRFTAFAARNPHVAEESELLQKVG